VCLPCELMLVVVVQSLVKEGSQEIAKEKP